MLAYFLAIAVGLGSFVLFMAAFFFPEVYRKGDFIWSGVGFFYALVLWFCAGRFTGAILLGQSASVALIGWLGWQTLRLRRDVTPQPQQTPTEAIAQKGTRGWFKGKTTQAPPTDSPQEDAVDSSDPATANIPKPEPEPGTDSQTDAAGELAQDTPPPVIEPKQEDRTPVATPTSDDGTPSESQSDGTVQNNSAASADESETTETALPPSEPNLEDNTAEPPVQSANLSGADRSDKLNDKPKFWQTGIFAKVGRLLRRQPKTVRPNPPDGSESSRDLDLDRDFDSDMDVDDLEEAMVSPTPAQSQASPEPESELDAQPESEPKSEPEPQDEQPVALQTEAQDEQLVEFEPELEPESELNAQPEPESESEPDSQNEPQPVTAVEDSSPEDSSDTEATRPDAQPNAQTDVESEESEDSEDGSEDSSDVADEGNEEEETPKKSDASDPSA